ncbi:Group XV phospholipase A2 [Blattella germanica]|nr:Group XV phospholipase A2 [Blattella germanica]
MCSLVKSLIFIVLIFISILSYSSTVSVVTRPSVTPVILVPGDGGSQVEAKLNKTQVVHTICEKKTDYFFNIWMNLELLVPVVIDCWIDNMKLVYDNVSRTTSNTEGVETRIPGFGDSSTVELLDPSGAYPGAYFKYIAKFLLDLGYERNVSLRGAPYDFRKAPNENGDYFVQLKALVEETYSLNDNTPVIIMAHSMGAPMSLLFLQSQSKSWKDKYVNKFITLAGAWGGSVKAMKVFLLGDNLGTMALRPSVMKEEQITNPSLAWLMPSNLFWTKDDILVQTPDKNYTVNDFQQFFHAPDVELHCLYGFGIDTLERLSYSAGKFPDGTPTYINGDGDGTVNKRSLEGCLKWQGKQEKKVYHQSFSKTDHMGILGDKRVFDYLQQVLREN